MGECRKARNLKDRRCEKKHPFYAVFHKWRVHFVIINTFVTTVYVFLPKVKTISSFFETVSLSKKLSIFWNTRVKLERTPLELDTGICYTLGLERKQNEP